MELELAGQTYRIGKLNALDQLHVQRRLSPLMVALGKGMATVRDQTEGSPSSEPETPAEEAKMVSTVVDAFGPVAMAFAKMDDQSVEYILFTCLKVVQRKAGEGWQQVVVANRFMFEDMDMRVLMRLTMTVIKENLGDFFPGLEAVS